VGTWRSSAPSALGFSSDGSLLAVAYGAIVTLWKPESLTLVGTLPHEHDVTSLSFLPCSPAIAVATAQGVAVWDLLTCSMWWSYSAQVRAMAVHPHRPALAILLDTATEPKAAAGEGEEEHVEVLHNVVLFGAAATSPVPTAVWPLPSATASITFVPANGTWSAIDTSAAAPMHVLSMSCDSQLQLLADSEQEVPPRARGDEAQPEPSAFDAAFAAMPTKRGITAQGATQPQLQAKRQEHGVFGGTPSHTMPPLTKVFGSFISQILPRRSDDATPASEGVAPVPTKGATHEDKARPAGTKRKFGEVEDPASVYAAFTDYFANGLQGSSKAKPASASKTRKRSSSS